MICDRRYDSRFAFCLLALVTVEPVAFEAIRMSNLTEDRLQFHPRGRGNGYFPILGGASEVRLLDWK